MAEAGTITCVTWNVAAVNNNPFEYWVTHDDESYLTLMTDVQAFIDAPTPEQDVEVGSIITDAIFDDLLAEMVKLGWAGVEETRKEWVDNYSKRRIISGFLKDKQVGAKRLASMPDRITNNITLADGTSSYRPTVISNSLVPLPDIQTWWAAWKQFMFVDEVVIPAREGTKTTRPCSMLGPILRVKYPAVTEEEEAMSVPLQALCLAIFDAVLVYMLNIVGPSSWHGVKDALCSTLSRNKISLTLRILEEQYGDAHIIFLQECAACFAKAIRETSLNEKFWVLAPAMMDIKRDQNSLILVSRQRFDGAAAQEFTANVIEKMAANQRGSLAVGDLLAMVVPVLDGGPPALLASFHGDTDGLATVPVLNAVCDARAAYTEETGPTRLIFGLDANAYIEGIPGKKLGAREFAAACEARGLGECWKGFAAAEPEKCCTTFNARTYLQPQLNKAVSHRQARNDKNTDRNPKDYVVFDKTQLEAKGAQPVRNNTGMRDKFDADAPFPTLHFPSDHAALLAELVPLQDA
mmetsp:Transcript_8717/g.22445  ORF Transcript_8717/g.22445 Transcript_8717/m.22445 type:complete len:522 (-) Transcript_8717:110-1675(-)